MNAERGRHELEQLLQKSEQEREKLRGQLLMSNARLRALTQGTARHYSSQILWMNLDEAADTIFLSNDFSTEIPPRLNFNDRDYSVQRRYYQKML